MTTIAEVDQKINLKHIVLPNDVNGVGAIIKLDGISIKGTVLSEEFQKNGGVIDLSPYKLYDNWSRIITGVEVPPVPVTYEMNNSSIGVLHPIAVRANIICKVLEDLKTGERKFISLERAVHAFYLELSNTIFGKSGVFNRWILGPRLKKSFRAVVIPGNYEKDVLGEAYEWVGIPRKIFDALGIQESDVVIIGRDPTIWMGSVEFLYAYPTDHDAIELHPLLLPQFGGDHDGDQLWGCVPDQSLVPHGKVAEFTRTFASWQKNFNDGHTSPDVCWKHFLEDSQRRSKTTGLSVSPSELLGADRSLIRVLDYCSTGKRVRGKVEGIEDLRTISQGLEVENWKRQTESINTAQLAMKVFMGPVGLLALRLITIGHANPQIRESANILAERCAQGLLDAKHLTYEQAKTFKPSEIFKILNLKDPLALTPRTMLAALQKIVPCDDRVLPILTFISRDRRGVQKMSRDDFPLFEGITSTASMDQKGYMPELVLKGQDSLKEGIISYAFHKGLE